MLTNNNLKKMVLVSISLLIFIACKKPEGPGGKATIKGKVHVSDWDNTQRYVISRGYAPDVRVYIMYGNDNIIGNDVRTGPDGSYEFRFLNKGRYRVFVNSLDTTIKVFKGNDTWHSVIKEVNISGTSEKKTLEDFNIAQ